MLSERMPGHNHHETWATDPLVCAVLLLDQLRKAHRLCVRSVLCGWPDQGWAVKNVWKKGTGTTSPAGFSTSKPHYLVEPVPFFNSSDQGPIRAVNGHLVFCAVIILPN